MTTPLAMNQTMEIYDSLYYNKQLIRWMMPTTATNSRMSSNSMPNYISAILVKLGRRMYKDSCGRRYYFYRMTSRGRGRGRRRRRFPASYNNNADMILSRWKN
jgi:hypothetical protein